MKTTTDIRIKIQKNLSVLFSEFVMTHLWRKKHFFGG